MRSDLDQWIAVDVIDGNDLGVGTVRTAGAGTDRNPARLVLLHRHADMADETPAAEAQTDVERGADEVANILARVDAQPATSALASVVEKAHNVLQGSGTYYSVLVAIVDTSRVIAAGIGSVNLQLWTSEGAEPVLHSTTVAVGSIHVLSSALGLGFDAEQIQTASLSLNAGDRIIAGVHADMSFLKPMRGTEPSSEVLQHIIEAANFERSAIVGVIASRSEK